MKSKSLEAKIRRFYTSSLLVCIVMFVLGTSIFRDVWGFLGSLIICFGGLYFVQQFYISSTVKSLPIAERGYKEVLLEKYEPDDVEESNS
jgi:hypothetical protein